MTLDAEMTLDALSGKHCLKGAEAFGRRNLF